MGIVPHEEAATRINRTFRKGHTCTKDTFGDHSTEFRIRCTGVDTDGMPCGWFTYGDKAFPEPAEEAAYLHMTKPTLLIPGSSDVLKATRIAETNIKPFRDR